jgi:uncharacterized repeat protein (TIGR01451 family)
MKPAAIAQSEVLDIPEIQFTPQIEGDCAEYEQVAHKASFTYADGSTAIVYLAHNSGILYICMEGKEGSFDDRFASVYLDPQGDGAGYTFAQQDDYGLYVEIPSTGRRTVRGTGVAGGWVNHSPLDGAWSAAGAVTGSGDAAEWSVSTSRFEIDVCNIFGIAVYHHWLTGVGDDYGWPSNQWFDQPRTWQPARMVNAACDNPQKGTIAYVFRGDRVDATSFYNLLTGAGYVVDLIPLSDVLSTTFDPYDLIIIADDSGYLDAWGQPGLTAQQVNRILAPDPDVPILGLGEGGYAFFGRLGLFIGWPNGWHGPEDEVEEGPGAPSGYYVAGGPVHQLYTNPVNEVGIYLGANQQAPTGVQVIGLEPPNPDHASLIQEGCRQLWGFSGNPLAMTGDGGQVFLNAVSYVRNFQCAPDDPPPEACFSIEKVASPAAGTTVAPGDVIEYTINYVWSDDPNCSTAKLQTKIIDFVPHDTMFVPGSATGGITPQPDGALVWPVTPAAGTQSVSFKVRVSDTQCANQRTVNNEARLLVPFASPESSGIVSHPVRCPDITFPNDEPPYAEEEVQIYPYPLIANRPSTITVKITNNASVAKTVAVRFQTSPERFGIGLDFSTFDTLTYTIPAGSSIIAATTYEPVVPGHYCIQITVQGTDPGDPVIRTQRNLDVTEDLQPGVPDDLVFNVGNPTGATADVLLAVDNTCPGWTAVVSPTLLAGMAPGEVRQATLTVTPPNSAVLGTGCHIDVQGWIDGELIGGIRKLDVPPVSLPVDVQPPYMEQEISLIPDPPVVGSPGQICVELQNPLSISRTVTLDYTVADFGAGIWFTSVATQTVTLPPNSIDDYCVSWTPDAGGTLHRCVEVTLMQPNYEDQKSQRNIEVVEGTILDILDLDLPLWVQNPDFGPHLLDFEIRTYGLGGDWTTEVVDGNGNPAPSTVGAGQTLPLMLNLAPGNVGLNASQNALPPYDVGDETRIEVDVLMDGSVVGGVAYVLDVGYDLFLPVVLR